MKNLFKKLMATIIAVIVIASVTVISASASTGSELPPPPQLPTTSTQSGDPGATDSQSTIFGFDYTDAATGLKLFVPQGWSQNARWNSYVNSYNVTIWYRVITLSSQFSNISITFTQINSAKAQDVTQFVASDSLDRLSIVNIATSEKSFRLLSGPGYNSVFTGGGGSPSDPLAGYGDLTAKLNYNLADQIILNDYIYPSIIS